MSLFAQAESLKVSEPSPTTAAIFVFSRPLAPKTPEVTPQVTPEVTPQVDPAVRLVRTLVGEMTRQQIQRALALKDEKHFREAYLHPALAAGLIEMTIPDKHGAGVASGVRPPH